jgi:urea transporter
MIADEATAAASADETRAAPAPISVDAAAGIDLRTAFVELVEPILNSYAIVFFSNRPALGAVLLAATFLAPLFGLFGLVGVVTALAGAQILGFPDAQIKSGELLFNSLLTALGVAYLTSIRPVSPALLAVLLPVVSLGAVLASATIGHLMRQLFGLPSLSIPFVVSTVMLFFLFYSLTRSTGPVLLAAGPKYLLAEPTMLPVPVLMFLQALGAAFFLPSATVGGVIFLGLALHSRLMLLLAILGFSAGMAFLHLTGLAAASTDVGWFGTNFVFCGIALGGVFYIPSRASVLLSAFGAVFCSLLAISMQTFLRQFEIPALSLPFNLVVMVVFYAMRRRQHVRFLHESPYVGLTPEAEFRKFRTYRRRFPHAHLPGLVPPFAGERVVTQAFHGKLTHRGPFAHALDFEALDADGEALPAARTRVENAYTFDTPVLAPCDGTVTRVVDHVADNRLGERNLRDNWGNLVLLVTDLGGYVLLCHFKRESIVVAAGQRVTTGQLLGACGNSGRSPLPHLHLQMQYDPAVGAATMPFCLRNYVTKEAAGRRFRLSGIPEQGARLEPLPFDADLAACFDAAPVTRNRYRIERDGAATAYETIELRISPWGERTYRSLEFGTTLYGSTAGGLFTALSFDGSPRSLLASMWLGLSVAPFGRDADMIWEDYVDPRPFLSIGTGTFADLTEPFRGIGFVRLERRMISDAVGMPTIVTEIGSRAHRNRRMPRKIEAFLAPQQGLVRLIVHDARGSTRIAQESREIVP